MPKQVPKAYVDECGSCHLAYPPGMLPAGSWQRIMAGLSKHYGSDASIDDGVARSLEQWLLANAASGRRAGREPPEDRITLSRWFVHEHDELPASIWTLPSVKSAANCGACHSDADQGRFSEHRLREPAGLNEAQRRAWRDAD